MQDAFVYALNDGLRVGALVALIGAVVAFVLIEPLAQPGPGRDRAAAGDAGGGRVDSRAVAA